LEDGIESEAFSVLYARFNGAIPLFIEASITGNWYFLVSGLFSGEFYASWLKDLLLLGGSPLELLCC
tara:strand:+ start:375 stop:575 length:201 start_codon:yes stop_codon:yes gene_type:complete